MRRNDEHRVGFVETGQVIEIGILPELIFGVVIAQPLLRSGNHGNAAFEGRSEAAAAAMYGSIGYPIWL